VAAGGGGEGCRRCADVGGDWNRGSGNGCGIDFAIPRASATWGWCEQIAAAPSLLAALVISSTLLCCTEDDQITLKLVFQNIVWSLLKLGCTLGISSCFASIS
jgi:hypothetical protein